MELILDSIVRALGRGEKVEIRGFGSFRTRQRQSRIGRNPKNGARVEVPPKTIPYLKPSKELRELIQRMASAVSLNCTTGFLRRRRPADAKPGSGCVMNQSSRILRGSLLL